MDNQNPKLEAEAARIAEFKRIPQSVRTVVVIGLVLGVVVLIRVLARAYDADLSLGKAGFYGFLMMVWFWLCSGSLFNRSRWGYVGLIALSALPLPGLLTFSIHLLRLAIEGTMTAHWSETIHCTAALLQLFMTCVVYVFLLSRGVREYVWKTDLPTPGANS
jgi:hypothetical protein